MIDEPFLEFLNSHNWPDIIKRLTAYCEWKVSSGKWWRRNKDELAKGFQPKDIVFEAINDLFSGERNWNRERYPTVIEFLKSAVDSEISTLIKSYDHTHQIIEFDKDDERDSGMDKYPNDFIDILGSLESEELLNRIYKSIEGDAKLEELLVLLLEELPPREIAKELDTDVEDIYNRKKRFRRILNKILNE
jgi:DNA-directed RNA polymerase specialized sigma24 family protein